VPDARLEIEIRRMFQARIRCEAFNEVDDLVGGVDDGADESGKECLVWWCDPEPNPQNQIDEREFAR